MFCQFFAQLGVGKRLYLMKHFDTFQHLAVELQNLFFILLKIEIIHSNAPFEIDKPLL